MENSAESKRFRISAENRRKIAKGAKVAFLGTVMAFLINTVPTLDMSPTVAMVVTGISSIIVNAIRQYLKDY